MPAASARANSSGIRAEALCSMLLEYQLMKKVSNVVPNLFPPSLLPRAAFETTSLCTKAWLVKVRERARRAEPRVTSPGTRFPVSPWHLEYWNDLVLPVAVVWTSAPLNIMCYSAKRRWKIEEV